MKYAALFCITGKVSVKLESTDSLLTMKSFSPIFYLKPMRGSVDMVIEHSGPVSIYLKVFANFFVPGCYNLTLCALMVRRLVRWNRCLLLTNCESEQRKRVNLQAAAVYFNYMAGCGALRKDAYDPVLNLHQ